MSDKGILVLFGRDSGAIPKKGLHFYAKSEMMCN